jgi:phage/plasmid-associated DNA primase
LKSGLSALRKEKFIVCTGEGRNGKGVLNDFFQILLGKYFGNLALTVLTKPFKEGANSELRSIDKKRFLKATEPDSGSNEKLRMSNIKGLTGENTIKARGLYESDYDITVSATIILECNTKPYIITDGNEAERQRLLIIPFEVCFTDNEEDIKNFPDKYKPKNDIYKTSKFKEQHASALFMFIVNYIPVTESDICPLYIPDRCIQLALQWVQDKDNLCSWFFDTYEPEEGNIISCSEVFHDYKPCLPREEKNMKLKDFIVVVSKKLKSIYLEPKAYYTHSKGKMRATGHSIKGYRRKVTETFGAETFGQFSIVDDPE